MSQVAIFVPSDPTVANRCKEFIPSANTPDYSGNSDALINPDLSGVVGVPVKHWKRSGDSVVEMSQAEKDSIAQAEADAEEASVRSGAKATLDNFHPESLYARAFADILKDEFNIVREWTRDFKTEVAAASNLADLKTRVATLPTLNDRTLQQLKDAIKDRVDSGDVD